MSLPKSLEQREVNLLSNGEFRSRHQVTSDFIRRLGLEKQLIGHDGCVNCLQWSENGEFLASGSDDVCVIVWDPFRGQEVQKLTTGHTGNIFSVKFMPQSNNNLVASGAADHKIQLHDMENKTTVQTFKKHIYRVKRMEVTSGCPNIIWSASEDGTIMETDIRSPPNEATVLVNLHSEAGFGIEAKCLSLNPVFPEYLAVGSSDAFIRMYDRRHLKCNVIQWPDDFTTPRERRSYLKSQANEDYDWSNQKYAKYFVAGHLPKANKTVHWRKEPFTSTYVTFSPNGQELLANMGSEQIYLFDVFRGKPILKETLEFKNFLSDSEPEKPKNGFHRYSSKTLELSKEALDLKKEANAEYDAERYSNAVEIYNKALDVCFHPTLLGNRAAAYIKRNWNGDMYSALMDCYNVIQLEPGHIKGHLRLIRCLLELKWVEEAKQYMNIFRLKFPDHSDVQAMKTLEKRLEEVESDVKEAESKRHHRRQNISPQDNSSEDEEEHKESCSEATKLFKQNVEKLKSNATDFKLRFCGHCNTTTDIKEANFFGSEGNFIIAGSDDGKFFIWDRKTTNIIKVLQGDDSIVNCLQPHPTTCFLATSGIDPYVRLWSPMPEDGTENDRDIKDLDKTTSANQRRMNADPFESFLMEMGYRVRDIGDFNSEENEENEEGNSGPVQCRTS